MGFSKLLLPLVSCGLALALPLNHVLENSPGLPEAAFVELGTNVAMKDLDDDREDIDDMTGAEVTDEDEDSVQDNFSDAEGDEDDVDDEPEDDFKDEPTDFKDEPEDDRYEPDDYKEGSEDGALKNEGKSKNFIAEEEGMGSGEYADDMPSDDMPDADPRDREQIEDSKEGYEDAGDGGVLEDIGDWNSGEQSQMSDEMKDESDEMKTDDMNPIPGIDYSEEPSDEELSDEELSDDPLEDRRFMDTGDEEMTVTTVKTKQETQQKQAKATTTSKAKTSSESEVKAEAKAKKATVAADEKAKQEAKEKDFAMKREKFKKMKESQILATKARMNNKTKNRKSPFIPSAVEKQKNDLKFVAASEDFDEIYDNIVNKPQKSSVIPSSMSSGMKSHLSSNMQRFGSSMSSPYLRSPSPNRSNTVSNYW